MSYTPPLHIYIVHHPSSGHARKLARTLALWLTEDPEAYTVPAADVPTFIWTAPKGALPQKVPAGGASATLIILLIDAHWLASSEWRAWAEALGEINEYSCLVVAAAKGALDLRGRLGRLNAVGLYREPKKRHESELKLHATYFVARKLLDGKKSSVFLSHAKADGRELALAVKTFLERKQVGGMFFDEVSLDCGEDFEEALKVALQTSVVVVFLTDRFAGRYWCGWEVMTAKSMRRPMLLVDALVKGEPSSLKYAGNTRTIRWDPKQAKSAARHHDIVAGALLELVRHQHNLARAKAAGLPASAFPLAAAPELAALPPLSPRGARTLVVHPDPPLAMFESSLIRDHRPDVDVQSLTQYLAGIPSLTGRIIAISISDGEDRDTMGTSKSDQERLWNRLAMLLLSSGARVAYGGDLRVGGYTDRLFDIVRGAADSGSKLPKEMVLSFLAWPHYTALDAGAIALLPDIVKIERVVSSRRTKGAAADGADEMRNRLSIAKMRSAMAARCEARVMVGGRLRGPGSVPGLVDELVTFVRARKPVYLVGAFGGMTNALGRAIWKADFEALRSAFKGRTRDDAYEQALRKARSPVHAGGYGEFVAYLKQNELANNGLSESENVRLLETRDLLEVTYLVFRGISNIFQTKG